MARHKILSTGYTLGARTITVTDTKFLGFNLENIRLIVNETQKIVYCSSMQNDLIKSIAGSVITIADSFANIVGTDSITVEMDMGFIGADALNAEVISGKTALASAISVMGQSSTISDSLDQMALKVKAISTSINVTPISGLPTYWHDLAFEISNFYDIDNPYAFAIILDYNLTNIYLSGAAKYKLSDGRILTGTPGSVTIGNNTDTTKKTRFIIYRNPNPNFAYNYGSTVSNVNYSNRLLQAYNYGCILNAIIFNGVSIFSQGLINDEITRVPYIINGVRTQPIYASGQFQSCGINVFKFPKFRDDATSIEKSITISASMFRDSSLKIIEFPIDTKTIASIGALGLYNTQITELIIPDNVITFIADGDNCLSHNSWLQSIVFGNGNLKNLYLIGNQVLCVNSLQKLIFPTGLDIFVLNNNTPLSSCPYLAYIYFSKPTTTFLYSDSNNLPLLTDVEFESDWNFSVGLCSIYYIPLAEANIVNHIFNKLVDCRADGINTPTLQTSTANANVIGTNTKFTKVHHVGETFYVNSVAKVIASITDDTHMTMTTNGTSTASGLSYGINKTMTIGATNLAKVTTEEKLIATTKGWSIN